MEQNKKVLIAGASFAGLTIAFWMIKMGYRVTIVEVAKNLKMGGSPVDIKDSTVDIVKRMGLFEKIKANRIGPEKLEFKNAEDITEHVAVFRQPGEHTSDDEFEIERDVLLSMFYDTIKHDCDFIFNNNISSITEDGDFLNVSFKGGHQDNFDLVFGCDGIHSGVRDIWFGDESQFTQFLGQYFSIAIADKLLVEEGTYQMYAEPNKGFALYAYNNKTDIIFTFKPKEEISYDFRNQEQIKNIVFEQMKGMKWRAPELREELLNSKSFYFDKFCQVKMESWTKGRVALIGDAAYCASPAAGMGGSLAIIGATALADAFQKHNGDYSLAFASYNETLKPLIKEVQTGAVEMLGKLLPSSDEEIQWRNKNGFAM